MSLDAKECVERFYTSDFYKNPDTIKDYLHSDVVLFWNSSAGFHKLKFGEISALSKEFTRSFDSLRADISHLLIDGDNVTIRFTYHVRTIENPDEELPMAHFIAIWQMKDGKMFRGHQISQQADDSPENLDSFLPIN